MSGAPTAGPSPTLPITEIVTSPEITQDASIIWLQPKIGDATFIGFKKVDGQEPITDLKVSYNDQDFAGDGFVKAPADINPQGTKRVFIWVKKGGAASPIITLKIIGEDPFAGAGFQKISASLNPGKATGRVPRLHLAFKTLASHRKHEERNWIVGDKLDALDTSNSWLVARVLKTKGEGENLDLHINYVGWPSRWDEWISRTSPRLAPLGYKTQGRWTGQDPKPPFNLSENMEKLNEVVAKCKEIEKELKDGKTLDDDHRHFLGKGENREFIENVLEADIEDAEQQIPIILDYVQTFLRIVAKSLTHKEVETRIINGLTVVFHSERRFYQTQGVTGKEKPQSKKFAKRPKEVKDKEVPTSVYLIDLINYFGEQEGFNFIGKRLLANTEEKSPFNDRFEVIWSLLASLSHIGPLLNSEFSKPFIKSLQLQKLCARTLQKLSDDELRTLDKDAFHHLLGHAKHLLLLVSKEKEVDEFSEKIQLDVSLRLLSAEVLRKRIDALTNIQNIIKSVQLASNPAFAKKEQERVEEQQRANQGYAGYYRRYGQPEVVRVEKAKYLSPETLVTWIKESKLVETILGKGSHEQLVKMSPSILKFLAQNQALGEEHLALLWGHINGGHDSLRRIVYEALAELAEEMNEKQVDALYARVSSLDLKEYRDFNLTFLKNFTINAVKATAGRNKWYGLGVFWQLLQDENARHLEKDVVGLAFGALREMLAGKLFESQRGYYLEQCINGLKQSKSVVMCLRLAPLLIEMHEPNVESLLTQLDKKYQLLDTLLADAAQYVEKAKKVAASRKDGEEKAGSPVLVGINTHFEQLRSRLTFLEFLVTNSAKLQLKQAHINSLWNVFVTNAIFPSDTALLLTWLNKAVVSRPKENKEGGKKFEIFTPDIAQHVFTLLCTAPLNQITKQWFDCFQGYFIELNFRANALKNPNPVWLTITDYKKLEGIKPALWTFAARATDPQVAAAARHFLTTIHIRLDPSLKAEDKRSIYGAFIQQCMSLLSQGYTAVKENKDQRSQETAVKQVSETVALLSSFLNRMESGEASKRPLYQAGEKITAYWKTQRPKKYTATVEDVNPELTYKVRYDDGDYDPKCPEENMFMPDGQVKRAVKSQSDEEDELYPKKLLASAKEYFELFFSLLGLGGEAADRVWGLLRFLPTNRDMEEKVLGLAGKKSVDWNAVLPTESIPKLLYTLQIVKNNILVDETGRPRSNSPVVGRPSVNPEAKVTDQTKAWCSMFLSQGGFLHLYNFFMKTPQEEFMKGILRQQCMALVMTILKFFVGGFPEIIGCENKAANDLVDFPALMERLLSLVAATISLKPDDQESAKVHADLISVTFSLLIHAATQDDKFLATVLKFPKWEDVLTQGLTLNQNALFRKELSNGLLKFASRANQENNPRSLFLPFLLKRLEHIDTASSETPCGEYFATLGEFIRQSVVLEFDSKALSAHLNKLLRSHPILEAHDKDVDGVLVELLTLTLQLVLKVPALKELLGAASGKEGLLQNIVDSLFEMPEELASFSYSSGAAGGNPPPKCKSPHSRQAAFRLLAEMCKDSPVNGLHVASLLEPNHYVSHSGKLSPTNWDFLPAEKAIKSKSIGYVGLRNLGCICYMNASMQQLFMIPRLRHNILSIDSYKLEKDLRNDIVFQLQYIFAHLQESEKEFVDPKPFTDIWMDETGKKPINVGKQEDASAFVIRLIDRIGENVKDGPFKDCFRNVLGGIFEHQLIGMDECPHSKVSRDEEFFTIPLEVKNKKNIMESLKSFVEGEVVEGFNCEGCKKKVNLKKRAVVKTLPPVLCLTLKRFVLNFETFDTEKLDDRIEFPMELDMYPYTAEALPIPKTEAEGKAGAEGKGAAAGEGKGAGAAAGEGKGAAAAPTAEATPATPAESGDVAKPEEQVVRPPEYYKYVLRGVVIHTGTAHSGHYYSFIQERLVSSDASAPMQAGKWFKFNDTRVTKFDPERIPEECFGGAGSSRGFGGVANGYLLFYDRADTASRPSKEGEEPLSPSSPASPASPTSPQQGAVARSSPNKAKKPQATRARAKIPPKIFQDIWQQNLTYSRDKSVFDEQYYEFLLTLAEDVKGSDADIKDIKDVDLKRPAGYRDAVTRVATRFFFMTLARAKNKQSLPRWGPIMRRLYANNISSSAWFLNVVCQPTTNWAVDFLLDCPEDITRQVAAEIMCTALANVAPQEQSSFAGDIRVFDAKEMKELKERTQHVSYYSYDDPPESKDGVFIPGQSPFEEKRMDERGFAVTLIDYLLFYLKQTPRLWRVWNEYYAVLATFASLGKAEATYAQKHELIGKLIDIYLKEKSPHPELNSLPVGRDGRRALMRHNNSHPDFLSFFKLLRHLACTQPFNQHSQIAQEMLSFKIFLASFFLEPTTVLKAGEVVPLIQHLSHEQKELSELMIVTLGEGLAHHNHDQCRPYIRVMAGMMEVQDSIQQTRVALLLDNYLKIMEAQRGFYKETDTLADFLIRFAKRFDMAFKWLHKNGGRLDWLIQWLKDHPKPVIDSKDMKLEKERVEGVGLHTDKWDTIIQTTKYSYYGLEPAVKVSLLEAIKNGTAEELKRDSRDSGYDSDAPLHSRRLQAGQEIDCVDTDLNWLKAKVVEVDNARSRAYISYEGWTEKWNEWISFNSPRIAERNRFTQFNPPKKKKNQ